MWNHPSPTVRGGTPVGSSAHIGLTESVERGTPDAYGATIRRANVPVLRSRVYAWADGLHLDVLRSDGPAWTVLRSSVAVPRQPTRSNASRSTAGRPCSNKRWRAPDSRSIACSATGPDMVAAVREQVRDAAILIEPSPRNAAALIAWPRWR